MLEKTLESSLDSQGIKPVNLKGNQPYILIGRTAAEAEAPVFPSPDVSSRLIERVPDAGKDQGQKEKRVSEDETAGWYHWCNEHQFGETPGNGEGQRSLEYCSPWSLKEWDTTGRLYTITTKVNLNLFSHMWLVAAVLGSIDIN